MEFMEAVIMFMVGVVFKNSVDISILKIDYKRHISRYHKRK